MQYIIIINNKKNKKYLSRKIDFYFILITKIHINYLFKKFKKYSLE
jgi:hypothetical protein